MKFAFLILGASGDARDRAQIAGGAAEMDPVFEAAFGSGRKEHA